MSSLDALPTCHSHLPVPFDTGTVRAFVGVSPPDSSSDGFPVGDYSRLVSYDSYALPSFALRASEDRLLTAPMR